MRTKERYRKVSTRIWNDAKFRRLSPDAKLTFLFFLTHPHMTSLGAMRATVAGMADDVGLDYGAFSTALDELKFRGMVTVDANAGLLVLPRFLAHNLPDSSKVVLHYAHALDMLPECALLDEHITSAGEVIVGLGDSYALAWQEVTMAHSLCDSLSDSLADTESKSKSKSKSKIENKRRDTEGGLAATSATSADAPAVEQPICAQPEPEPQNGRQSLADWAQEVQAAWNAMAEAHSLPRVLKLTATYLRHLTARRKSEWWRDNWQAGLDAIPSLPFLLGENDRGWRANFDWFVRSDDSLQKVLGGNYGKAKSKNIAAVHANWKPF